MKRYRLIQTACLAAMAVGLASCSQEDLASLGVAEGTPVTFTATGLAMPQVETRATTDGTWEEGMMVGVKIGSEAKEYAVSPDATDPTKATLAATQGVTPFYWAIPTPPARPRCPPSWCSRIKTSRPTTWRATFLAHRKR